jgi:hypothetical protein
MREKSIVPTNLPDWPRVTALLPEQKLVLGLGLWAGRYTNTIGVAVIPMRPLAASLGLDPAALECGIKTLIQESLVLADWDSCEFFVCDWFRFHTFRGAGVAIAQREFMKISSPTVASAVVRAAPWLVDGVMPTKKTERNNANQRSTLPTAATNPTSSASERRRSRRESGIVTFFPDDEDRAAKIEQQYSPETIEVAVRVVEDRSKEPVPGLVEKEIELRARASARHQLPTQAFESTQAPSRIQSENGLKLAWKALGKRATES